MHFIKGPGNIFGVTKRADQRFQGENFSMREKIDLDEAIGSLVDLAIEAWRFQKLFGKALAKLDQADAARFVNQHRFFLRKINRSLETAGLRLVNLEGQPYEDGSAATALNIADFENGDLVIVDQMIEPIVMKHDGLLRAGTVLLRKAN